MSDRSASNRWIIVFRGNVCGRSGMLLEAILGASASYVNFNLPNSYWRYRSFSSSSLSHSPSLLLLIDLSNLSQWFSVVFQQDLYRNPPWIRFFKIIFAITSPVSKTIPNSPANICKSILLQCFSFDIFNF